MNSFRKLVAFLLVTTAFALFACQKTLPDDHHSLNAQTQVTAHEVVDENKEALKAFLYGVREDIMDSLELRGDAFIATIASQCQAGLEGEHKMLLPEYEIEFEGLTFAACLAMPHLHDSLKEAGPYASSWDEQTPGYLAVGIDSAGDVMPAWSFVEGQEINLDSEEFMESPGWFLVVTVDDGDYSDDPPLGPLVRVKKCPHTQSQTQVGCKKNNAGVWCELYILGFRIFGTTCDPGHQ